MRFGPLEHDRAVLDFLRNVELVLLEIADRAIDRLQLLAGPFECLQHRHHRRVCRDGRLARARRLPGARRLFVTRGLPGSRLLGLNATCQADNT
jgi:hypothetical protein